MEYVIVGDTKEYKECLVYVCGKDRKNAEKCLERMLTNPDEQDLRMLERHCNLRIVEVESKDCWWNDPFLAN